MNIPTLIKAVLMIAIVMMLALYGSASLILPQPAPVSASPERFSAERAMSHVQELAQAPRVVGSPEISLLTLFIVERKEGS
jgi:hypothetical protein